MSQERPPLKDGYEYVAPPPDTTIRLVDPVWCPTGHPADLIRLGQINCTRHAQIHFEWWCSCGQKIYRWQGAFVDVLPCQRQ